MTFKKLAVGGWKRKLLCFLGFHYVWVENDGGKPAWSCYYCGKKLEE